MPDEPDYLDGDNQPAQGDSSIMLLHRIAGGIHTLLELARGAGLGVAPVAAPANSASGQVTAGGSAATLVAARETRRNVLVRNLDAALSVHVGPATVTTSNGMLLAAGDSILLPLAGLLQVIAASGAPVVAYWEFYD